MKEFFKRVREHIAGAQHHGLIAYMERQQKIRKLGRELRRFEREMTPQYIQGRVIITKEINEAKRNGSFELFQIAKQQQKLLMGER